MFIAASPSLNCHTNTNGNYSTKRQWHKALFFSPNSCITSKALLRHDDCKRIY